MVTPAAQLPARPRDWRPPAVMLNPRTPSGVCGVYAEGDRWRAKVKRRDLGGGLHLGYYRTRFDAAWAVACWYERRFGPTWQDVFRWRRRNVIAVRRWPGPGGGWVAEAWINGKATCLGRDGSGDGLYGWPSREAARREAERWAERELGRRWRRFAWRADPRTRRSPARAGGA